MLILGILVSLIVFSIIVILHELGHFSAARLFGVKVNEFGLGIPPKAKKLFTDKKGTQYTLNWLPLGGFVKLVGENPATFYVYNQDKKLYNNKDLEKDILEEKAIYYKDGSEIGELERQHILKALEDNKAAYNLANKPAWQQSIIILAGVAVNFLLAGIIFSVLFFIGISPIGINTKLETQLPVKMIPNYSQALESGILIKNPGVILQPVEGSIAQQSGIQTSDIIKSIDGIDISSAQNFIDIINNSAQKTLSLEIYQPCPACPENAQCKPCETQIKTLEITPDENGKIGAYISENIEYNRNFEYKYGVLESIKYGFSETYYQSLLTFQGISTLLKKIVTPETPDERQEAISQVSGPIGIVDFITNSLSGGVKFMFIIAAIISINLGVFNLLPIPALDGGRFVFISINSIVKKLFGRKAIHAGIENIIHISFFILLIALSILIAYNDVIKIING